MTTTTKQDFTSLRGTVKNYTSEPVFTVAHQQSVFLDEEVRLVSNENGRSLQIRLDEKTVVYAAINEGTPIKESYIVKRLVAVRDADYKGRSIKKGHEMLRAE